MATATKTEANGRTAQAVTTEAKGEHAALLDSVVEATQVQRYSLEEVRYMATAAAKSGMFKMNEHQAFTLMMLCEADNMHPMHALRRWHITSHGTPTMKADAILAEMMRQGWSIEWLTECDDVQVQEAFFQHPKRCPKGKNIRFGVEDAERAGLTAGPNKANWTHYPGNMCRARVASNGCRMLDPGIIAGVYTPEEASEFEPAKWSESPQPAEPAPIPAPRTERPKSFAQPASTHSEAIPNRSPMNAWITEECQRTRDRWANICLLEGKEPGKTPPVQQVANHLLKRWIEAGILEEAAILTDGKRDKFKIAQVMTDAWQGGADDNDNDINQAEIKSDVRQYLWIEVCKLAEAAGIEPPAQTEWTEE